MSPRTIRLTEDECAWAAWEWAHGRKQREIAKLLGYRSSSPVCIGIRQFIADYTDIPRDEWGAMHGYYGPARKPWVSKAWKNYNRQRGSGKFRLRIKVQTNSPTGEIGIGISPGRA